MSVLRKIEMKLTDLVEGTFSRAFKSQVKPVELAQKLIREMDRHKTVSVSRTYAPNEYSVYLSEKDYEHLAPFKDALIDELASYLLEYARRQRLALLTRPQIELHVDENLRLGSFGIQTRLVHAPEGDAPAEPGEHGQTTVFKTAEPPEVTSGLATLRRQKALLTLGNKQIVLQEQGLVLGRSRQCDVVLDDANVSRQHARISCADGVWSVSDLGSTNGVFVNGQQIDRSRELSAGDHIRLGTSDLQFELE